MILLQSQVLNLYITGTTLLSFHCKVCSKSAVGSDLLNIAYIIFLFMIAKSSKCLIFRGTTVVNKLFSQCLKSLSQCLAGQFANVRYRKAAY